MELEKATEEEIKGDLRNRVFKKMQDEVQQEGVTGAIFLEGQTKRRKPLHTRYG